MVTIRVRYENGHFVPLDPLPDLREGEVIRAALLRDLSEDSAIFTMLASEDVLRRDWDTPEEDEAWAHL